MLFVTPLFGWKMAVCVFVTRLWPNNHMLCFRCKAFLKLDTMSRLIKSSALIWCIALVNGHTNKITMHLTNCLFIMRDVPRLTWTQIVGICAGFSHECMREKLNICTSPAGVSVRVKLSIPRIAHDLSMWSEAAWSLGHQLGKASRESGQCMINKEPCWPKNNIWFFWGVWRKVRWGIR
jgi:hypothetical protein